MARTSKNPSLPGFDEPTSLPDAASKIISLSQSINERAYRLGETFLWVKKRVGHGNFGSWLADNVVLFTERTARNYMAHWRRCRKEKRLLRYEFGKSATVADLDMEQNEYYSPADAIEGARRVLGGIDLDPASCDEANAVVKAKRYFTRKQNGLTKEWRGLVWCNPPYVGGRDGGGAGDFVAKLVEAYRSKRVPGAILLLGAHHVTLPWFEPLLNHTLCFSHGRLKFRAPGGKEILTRNGSVLVCLGLKYRDAFFNEFWVHGNGARIGHMVESHFHPLSNAWVGGPHDVSCEIAFGRTCDCRDAAAR
jgi:hypothetical protein